jgi:hypothetical protein
MNAQEIARVVLTAEAARNNNFAQPDESDVDAAASDVQSIIDKPNEGPSNPHRRWVGSKTAEDWEYGEKYDEASKKDPLLVPFGDLPEDERVAAHLKYAIVRVLSSHDGTPETAPNPAE